MIAGLKVPLTLVSKSAFRGILFAIVFVTLPLLSTI